MKDLENDAKEAAITLDKHRAKFINAFMGLVMKASQGKAKPKETRRILNEKFKDMQLDQLDQMLKAAIEKEK